MTTLSLRLSCLLAVFLPAATAATLSPGAPQVTFARDISPILQDKCETCHRPGQGAPMNLQTYEGVRPWARSIKYRVASRQMPPWNIDKSVGIQHFQNDRSLSDQQIATIVKWVDDGAPSTIRTICRPPKSGLMTAAGS